jgi:hypothetical protein
MEPKLDNEMLRWSSRLINELKFDIGEANKLSSIIYNEMISLPDDTKKDLRVSSFIPIKERIDEMKAFQGWMVFANNIKNNPFVTIAQVITMNYVCFVYLGNGLFKKLKSIFNSQNVTGKCCRFLLNNPVQAFRNAIAHGNWKYLPDFSDIEFWSQKGSDINESYARFEVLQEDLSFWQALARCTAYSSYLALEEMAG